MPNTNYNVTQTRMSVPEIVFPPGSARGLEVEYQPITTGRLWRTINGELRDATRETHRKYRITISCNDQLSPTLAALNIGQQVNLTIPMPWRQPIVGGTATLIRTPAPETVQCFTGPVLVPHTLSDNVVTTSNSANYVEYRPILSVRVVEFSWESPEWSASDSWSITFEEI